MENPNEKETILEKTIREYFSIGDRINRFNNSEIIYMPFRYTRNKCYFPFLLGDVNYFPCKATDIEIANVIKRLISVPFHLSIEREASNLDLIYSIVISRVFIPNQ